MLPLVLRFYRIYVMLINMSVGRWSKPHRAQTWLSHGNMIAPCFFSVLQGEQALVQRYNDGQEETGQLSITRIKYKNKQTIQIMGSVILWKLCVCKESQREKVKEQKFAEVIPSSRRFCHLTAHKERLAYYSQDDEVMCFWQLEVLATCRWGYILNYWKGRG